MKVIRNQTAKRVLRNKAIKNCFQCPECKKHQGLLDGVRNNFCWNCGTKLDWEEE